MTTSFLLRMRNTLWAVTLLCLVPLLAASLVHAQSGGAGGPPAATPVIVAEARLEPVAERIEALGTLRANESVAITSNVTETISVVHFDDGQRVSEGDMLVEMTSAEEHALLEEAQARVAEAQSQYDRVRSLVAQRSASESLLDERKRDLDTARAVLVALESRLADRVVKAPFDGVVGLRNISRGALVEPGDLITTLDDDSVMKLDFTVPSLYLEQLKPGLQIQARGRDPGEGAFS
jgi:membrane fusion protein, multidrug efflux system